MVDVFDNIAFENALPITADGKKLWRYIGLEKGERCYIVPVNAHVGIYVRSSVNARGVSASAGEDSIRAYLVYLDSHKPAGSKLNKYTTRVRGWDVRMKDMLRKLWYLGKHLGPCPDCGQHTMAYVTNKEGVNKGRAFRGCSNRNCKFFQWLTAEALAKTKLKVPQAQG